MAQTVKLPNRNTIAVIIIIAAIFYFVGQAKAKSKDPEVVVNSGNFRAGFSAKNSAIQLKNGLSGISWFSSNDERAAALRLWASFNDDELKAAYVAFNEMFLKSGETVREWLEGEYYGWDSESDDAAAIIAHMNRLYLP